MEKILTEAQEQKIIFKWIRAKQIRYPKLQLAYSTLNGVRLNPKLRKEMKEQGNRKGVPDIVLPVANEKYHGLYIELKRIKGGQVSKDQRECIEKLNEGGYLALVCKGHIEAIETIKSYLGV